MKFLNLLKGNARLFFDGGMGTLLQQNGLKPGELGENWNVEKPDIILKIHKDYIENRANIIKTNTFSANALKFENNKFSLEEVVKNGVKIAREAAGDKALVALDVGPLGKLLAPLGDLEFEKAIDIFKEIISYGHENCDLILIETMADLYEIKAAMIAAKEVCDLPVVVTVTLDESGRLLTGADVKTTVATIEALGATAVGLNCGFGPSQMQKYILEMAEWTDLPIIANANAGLPKLVNGETVFDLSPRQFAKEVASFAPFAKILGGCCGTTPKHIEAVNETCKNILPKETECKNETLVTSGSKCVEIGERPIVIGERINPTGKPDLKKALLEGDKNYVISQALEQLEGGADVLDVNVGVPNIDEAKTLSETVYSLQKVTSIPLQLDSNDTVALEKSMRIYNGKPLVNSLNGKDESLHAVLPLVKKYGGVVVALLLDENGIPNTVDGRVKIAKKIIEVAKEYGICQKDIMFDPLALAISTDENAAKTTVDTLKFLKDEMGANTILGVSNISYGLPERENINSTFFTLAMNAGLSAGIINPNSNAMMTAFYSFCALNGFDKNLESYVDKFAQKDNETSEVTTKSKLSESIVNGLPDEAADVTAEMLKSVQSSEIIDNHLVVALDEIGKKYESRTIFLPQMLRSAAAAKACFKIIKNHNAKLGTVSESRGDIVIATVHGDVHDIGKNIVAAVLENYNFNVIDLGKNVPAEEILKVVKSQSVKLVGLSALMTTTVISMKETIALLKAETDCKIMVGGAVLTEDIARDIGADFYSDDAMGAVKIAKEVFDLEK